MIKINKRLAIKKVSKTLREKQLQTSKSEMALRLNNKKDLTLKEKIMKL